MRGQDAMQINVEKEGGRGGEREGIISGTPNYYRNLPANLQGNSHFYRSYDKLLFHILLKQS